MFSRFGLSLSYSCIHSSVLVVMVAWCVRILNVCVCYWPLLQESGMVSMAPDVTWHHGNTVNLNISIELKIYHFPSGHKGFFLHFFCLFLDTTCLCHSSLWSHLISFIPQKAGKSVKIQWHNQCYLHECALLKKQTTIRFYWLYPH